MKNAIIQAAANIARDAKTATLITSGTGVVGAATYWGLTSFEIGAIAGLIGAAGTVIVVGLQIRLHILKYKLIKKQLENENEK